MAASMNRRAVLAGVASASIVPLPSIAAADFSAVSAISNAPVGHNWRHADATLAEVFRFSQRLNRDYEKRCLADEDDPSLCDLADIENEALQWIAANPAAGFAGLRTKADAPRSRLPMTPGTTELSPLYADIKDRLALSLIEDLMRLLEVRS